LKPWLVPRRMPAGDDPIATGVHSDVSIQCQGGDRRPAGGRHSNDQVSLFAPTKVVSPKLVSGVEQANNCTRFPVDRRRPVAAMEVAQSACQPKVIFLRRPTERL